MLALLFLLWPATPPPATWDPGTTWAVVAGVVRWADPHLPAFDPRNRKDLDFMRVLAERGVPEAQRSLLIDRDATAPAVLASLTRAVTQAPPGATFIVYFDGHGVYDDGRFLFATADTNMRHLDTTGLDLAALFQVLILRGPADRVLLFGDACYAGHLAALAGALTFVGVPTISLASAAEASESSENWTFTQALIDGFSGRAIIDRDGDGAIQLSEIATEARTAMRFRERQPIGYAPLGFPDLNIAPTQAWRPDLAALAPRGDRFARGDWIVAKRLDGARSIARVLGAQRQDDGSVRLRVEYYDYAERAYAWAREDRADPVVFFTYPVGTRLRVTIETATYEAVVLRIEDELHYVDLVELIAGEPVSERPRAAFVTPDQILGPVDPAIDKDRRVLVEDGGALYEAIVKARIHGQVCVRYPGSPFIEDNCVPETRVTRDPRAR